MPGSGGLLAASLKTGRAASGLSNNNFKQSYRRIEAIHQVYNTYSRILAPMRHKGDMLVVCMKRDAIMKRVGNCTIATPRKFKNRNAKFGAT